MDSRVANRLLDLLSTDDDFRALFVAAPNAALAKAGYVLPEGVTDPSAGPGACFVVTSLASKESIARARAQLETELSMPFQFKPPAGMEGDC
jgi:putative modified peptide